MALSDHTIRCDGCGVEISLSPVIKGNYKYCCQDCARGLECDCSKKAELDDDRNTKYSSMDVL